MMPVAEDILAAVADLALELVGSGAIIASVVVALALFLVSIVVRDDD